MSSRVKSTIATLFLLVSCLVLCYSQSTKAYSIGEGDSLSFSQQKGAAQGVGTWTLILPSSLSMGKKIVLPSGSVKIIDPENNGYRISLKTNFPIELNYNGWKVLASGVKIDSSNDKYLSAEKIKITYRSQDVVFENAVFYTDGTLVEQLFTDNRIQLPILDNRLKLIRGSFSEDGLWVEGFLEFPPWFGSYLLYFDSIQLFPSGVFKSESGIERFAFEYGTFAFEFEDLYLSIDDTGKDCLSMNLLRLDFPKNVSINSQIQINNLYIKNDGQLRWYDDHPDSLYIEDKEFSIESLLASENMYIFHGTYNRDSSSLKIKPDTGEYSLSK